MTFLLTNDDGIEAPGLAALHRAVEGWGQSVVVAPDRHLSGCGHHVTTSRPLELTQTAEGWYALDGSPVDCARVGIAHVAPHAAWVLAGINEGGNLGSDIYPSGTVAAAREACLLGVRAIAISQYVRRRPIDWLQAGRWARHALSLLLERPLERGSFWNVNLPQPDESADVPECVFCAIDPSPLPVKYELNDGKLHYRARYHDRQQAEGRDVEICFSGKITISKIDLHVAPRPEPAGSLTPPREI
jgi:5'-nucleotidase